MKREIKYISLILLLMLPILNSCKKETSCENCRSANDTNKPPIAVAGPDQVITLPTDSVLLDGRTSSDPDGIISEWLWTKISGPASFNIIKPTDSLTKVKALVAGTYLFELKVTGNGGLSARDTMQVFVNSTTNHPPIANAGNDTTIALPNNSINLDGSRSTDPENKITSYAWTKISGPPSFSIANANTVQTQVTNLVQGTYQFELKVTDASGLFSKDTMQVVLADNSSSKNYFPLTIGSYWNYFWTTNTSVPDYAVNNISDYNRVVGANIYSAIVQSWTAGTGNDPDSSYYRKSGANYYQLLYEDLNTSDTVEYIFLKDNAIAGTSWQSPVFSGTYIKMTILEYAVPVIVNGLNFPDVIKVKYEYFNSSNPSVTTTEQWFANNVGLIKMTNMGSPYFSISGFHVF